LSASTSSLPAVSPSPAPPPSPAAPAWKGEVSARVRAHRSAHARVSDEQLMLPGLETGSGPSTIAARVAERYARIPSWREAMAAEAAAAAAPPAPPPVRPAAARRAPSPAPLRAAADPAPALEPDIAPASTQTAPCPAPPWQPDLIRYSVSSDSLPVPRSTPAQARARSTADLAIQLDPAELPDPLQEAIVEPTRLLPARVIDFPRELVAPRKARPRLAEGPLCEEPHSDRPPSPQPATRSQASLPPGLDDLRIVEAEPEMAPPVSIQPRNQANSVPEWHSIHLDSEEPVRESKAAARPSLLSHSALHVAPMEDRLMAGLVDIALTLAAFLVFVLVFAACTTHPPVGRAALLGAGIALLAMGVLYQVIFFSLSAATPGMRYARIALCTFDDENPTRRAMRARIAALLLSALPLGLGFLWAVFDEDALGWHDRITQTYQRSYRES